MISFIVIQMFVDFYKTLWKNNMPKKNRLSLVFTFISGGPRNSNSNPSKVRTDHIQRIPRATNERKTEEYVAHITKERLKEHLKIAKELVKCGL